MAELDKLTISLPKSTTSQVTFWSKKWGISQGKAVMYLLRLGAAEAVKADTLGYLDYLSRTQAKKKGAKDG